MITSLTAKVSESATRGGMSVVETLKELGAAWKVGTIAAKQPKATKPSGMSDEYIARVRAIAEERGLDIDEDPTNW